MKQTQTSRPCTPDQALAAWLNLPPKARNGVVGTALRHIITLLREDGTASLATVLAELFPGEPLESARKILATQIANRAYATESGQVPLRLCISRKSALTALAAQQLWFEADASDLPSDAPLDHPRSHAAQFVNTVVQAIRGDEYLKDARAEKKLSTAARDALNEARLSQDKTDANQSLQGKIVHGITPNTVSLGTGSTRRVGDYLPNTQALRHGVNGQVLGQSVICLNAMLEWASDMGSKAPRLLALLGDYGTGKTSHAMQLDRVLNGLVGWPEELPQPAGVPKPALIDLSLLAGVSNMAVLSLTELLTVALNKRRSGAVIDAETLIARARAGEVVMIYDGLDELLKDNEGHALHNLLDQLLRVLESDPATGKPSKAKVMVSCRTHYFRDLQTQHAFFDTRRRGVAQANDYLCLNLLPWNERSVSEYLHKRLEQNDAAALLGIIQTTYNLAELASKPVLLSMMCEQVGQLVREKQAGQPITASRLYGITVAECLGRDNGKHTLKGHHKPLLMGALATALWNEGVEQWSADKLDGWLARTVPALFPNQYGTVDMGALQDDLRTATFIVRTSARGDQFNFSHRSFMEYFVARWVWDCANLQHDGLLDEAVIRNYLPARRLNKESTDFVREIWVSNGGVSGEDNANISESQQSVDTARNSLVHRQAAYLFKYLQSQNNTLEQRDALFDLILNLNLLNKQTIHQITRAGQKIIHPTTALNLQGLERIQERWEDLDFSPLPPLDVRDANLLCLRAWRCNFGVMHCSGGNWAQTVFRDCEMAGMDWGDADKGGMMVRFGERKPIVGALKGPWTRPDFEGRNKNTDAFRKYPVKSSVMYKIEIFYCMQTNSKVLFDLDGNLLDYDDEAADTWLFCLASGRPEPVETALPVE